MADRLTEYFGQVVAGLRDRVISDWQKMLSGGMKGPTAERVRERLKGFSAEQITRIQDDLLPDIVDGTIHDFLVILENLEELRVRDDEQELLGDVLEDPDGLVLPLFGPEGWIARFSKKPSHFTE